MALLTAELFIVAQNLSAERLQEPLTLLPSIKQRGTSFEGSLKKFANSSSSGVHSLFLFVKKQKGND